MSPAAPASDRVLPWHELVQAVAQHRDRESFMRLYDHYAPRLQRYLLGLGAPPGAAEELVQETLLKLWLHAHAYDPARAMLSTWLFRIARNQYLDSIRRDRVWAAMQLDLDALSLPEQAAEQPSAGDAVDETKLRAAMQELPERQARVIHMSYFEAKSHRQIAEELGLPVGTVKSCIRLAFARLRGALQG
ncbi:RNA polymerase sigma-70 factor [plant metagenome]|uniref:RNA polymerase sigma-70 factor n=1 Tax=plant metagenome TaxID=1297885 RepID=A0A484P3T8_9ZZZZ